MPCLTWQESFPNSQQFPADTNPRPLSGTLGSGAAENDPQVLFPAMFLCKPTSFARDPRAQQMSDFVAPSSLPFPSPPHARNKALALRELHPAAPPLARRPSLGVQLHGRPGRPGGGGGDPGLTARSADPGLYITLRFGTGWGWLWGWRAEPGTRRPQRPPSSPARSPVAAPLSPSDRGTSLPRRPSLRPLRPLPRNTPPRHFTTKSALLAQPGIETSRSSFLLRVPASRTRTLANQRRSRPFVPARPGPPPRARGSSGWGTGRPAAPRRAATGGDGAAAPAHPSRRTLVFRVYLPHQRDVSLQVERQRLDGVQVVLHIVHQVDLLPVGRAQHGSPRSPATRRGFPLPPAPAPSEPSAAKCKAPARRRPPSGRPRAATSASRAAWARGPGAWRARPALGGLGRGAGAGGACGRAPRRKGRGRGRASAGRGARRPPRRTCPTWRTQIPVSNTWETFGPPHRACAPPPIAPSPRAPPPLHHAPHRPGSAGVWLCLSLWLGRGSRGQGRRAKRKLY